MRIYRFWFFEEKKDSTKGKYEPNIIASIIKELGKKVVLFEEEKIKEFSLVTKQMKKREKEGFL